MCDVLLVHELDSLIGSQSALIMPNPETKTYLADLVEKGHKLSECLEPRVIEGTQEGRNHQLLPGVGQIDNVEQWHTMVA